MPVKPTTDLISESDWGAYTQMLKDMKASLERVEAAVIGNGKPGLMTRTSLLEDKVSSIWRLVVSIAGVVGVGAAGVVWNLITHTISIKFP